MKVNQLIIALLACLLVCLPADARKKKQKAEQTEPTDTVAPFTLTSVSDTLSYAGGIMLADGLIPYLLKHKIDTAYLDHFVRGYAEMSVDPDDPAINAYLMGADIAKTTKSRMIKAWNKEMKGANDSIIDTLVYKGFIDAVNGDTAIYGIKEAGTVFKATYDSTLTERDERLFGDNRRAGEKFLERNKTRPGVVVSPSGLQHRVIVEGTGAKPKATDKVLVNYEGRLINGIVFDSSAKHGDKPSEFKVSSVIKGWQEALKAMKVGSKWELFVPYDLAYGNKSSGSKIKPFSALVFDIELVGIDQPRKVAPKKTE